MIKIICIYISVLSLMIFPALSNANFNDDLSAGKKPALYACNIEKTKTRVSVDDASIMAQLKAKIEAEPILRGIVVDAKVRRGNVNLSGLVEANIQAAKVITIAQSIDGVNEVNTKNLKVKNSQAPLADSYITAKVKGILMRTDLLDISAPGDIKVETKNGVVYLSGYVPNQEQGEAVIKTVRSIRDVKAIEDGLKVRR